MTSLSPKFDTLEIPGIRGKIQRTEPGFDYR